ncbi:NTP transferase domain-containing protein [Candidatus Pelagibacter bacterium]|nr:NTP transferase domain-containing protein [Candidatus Pelagibacter bacterium]MDA9619233.1 NTP transferase domain-containing protein [Candidatus Pelagibacter bacterium]
MTSIVFLAAGKSSRIYKDIKKPKCLITIENKTLIKKLVRNAIDVNIKNISIVTGYKSSLIKKELKEFKEINYIFNKYFRSKEMLYSMMLALEKISGDLIFSYSDIIYDKKILKKMKNNKNFIQLPILSNWKKIWKQRKKNMFKDAENLIIDNKNNLKMIGQKIKNIKKVKYQYMGLIYIPNFLKKNIVEIYLKTKNKKKMHISKFLNIISKNKKIQIKCIKYNGFWYEFDDLDDYTNYYIN